MGCGKGMIAFRVAADPCVTELVVCDLSRGLATEFVERVFHSHVATGGRTSSPGSSSEASGVTCSLSTHVRDASNFAGLADATFDAASSSTCVDVLPVGGLPGRHAVRGPAQARGRLGQVPLRRYYLARALQALPPAPRPLLHPLLRGAPLHGRRSARTSSPRARTAASRRNSSMRCSSLAGCAAWPASRCSSNTARS